MQNHLEMVINDRIDPTGCDDPASDADEETIEACNVAKASRKKIA